jgi:hypothetical protein
VNLLLGMSAQIHKGANPTTVLNTNQPTLEAQTKKANAAWRKAGLSACA